MFLTIILGVVGAVVGGFDRPERSAGMAEIIRWASSWPCWVPSCSSVCTGWSAGACDTPEPFGRDALAGVPSTGPAPAFDAIHVCRRPCPVGGPDFHLTRPGFWHGAFAGRAPGPGGRAASSIDKKTGTSTPGRIRTGAAHLGAMEAQGWAMPPCSGRQPTTSTVIRSTSIRARLLRASPFDTLSRAAVKTSWLYWTERRARVQQSSSAVCPK